MESGKTKQGTTANDNGRNAQVASISAIASKILDDKIKTLMSKQQAEDKKKADIKAVVVDALEDVIADTNSKQATPNASKGKDFLVSILKNAKK